MKKILDALIFEPFFVDASSIEPISAKKEQSGQRYTLVQVVGHLGVWQERARQKEKKIIF